MDSNCFDCFCVYPFYDHSFGVATKIFHRYEFCIEIISISFLYEILLLMSLCLKQGTFVLQVDEEPFATLADGNAFGIIA